jgi:putative transposase
MPELAKLRHFFVKASARVNNQGENSHQSTRERERRMRGFRDPERTQAFLSSFGPIRQHFALKRSLIRASLRRKNNSANALPHCIVSPSLPKIRPAVEESSVQRKTATRTL